MILGRGGFELRGLPVYTREWTISGSSSHGIINSRRTHSSDSNILSTRPLSAISSNSNRRRRRRNRVPLSSAKGLCFRVTEKENVEGSQKSRMPDQGSYPPLSVAYLYFLQRCRWPGSCCSTVNMRWLLCWPLLPTEKELWGFGKAKACSNRYCEPEQ